MPNLTAISVVAATVVVSTLIHHTKIGKKMFLPTLGVLIIGFFIYATSYYIAYAFFGGIITMVCVLAAICAVALLIAFISVVA
ncbi:MAG: hypothetical protein NT003_02065 [Candidatus Magasanikbacteria bacterium]|nr:hypothetical protein [Candidatus Magasanikbacteria bacterium]